MQLTRPLTAAPVAGWPALVCHRMLAERVDQLAAGVHPDLAEQLRETLAALRQAGEAWAAWRRSVAEVEAEASAGASASAAAAVAGAVSAEVDTTTAAALLGVTPSRVRQLARCRRLPGRKAGRVWLVSAAALAMYAEGRDGRIR